MPKMQDTLHFAQVSMCASKHVFVRAEKTRQRRPCVPSSAPCQEQVTERSPPQFWLYPAVPTSHDRTQPSRTPSPQPCILVFVTTTTLKLSLNCCLTLYIGIADASVSASPTPLYPHRRRLYIRIAAAWLLRGYRPRCRRSM